MKTISKLEKEGLDLPASAFAACYPAVVSDDTLRRFVARPSPPPPPPACATPLMPSPP
jgi:hypothetical protein